jgi:hypothetical protein
LSFVFDSNRFLIDPVMKHKNLIQLFLVHLLLQCTGDLWTQISFVEVQNTPFEAVYQSSIAFNDIDGDGDQDLLITGRTNGSSFVSKIYLNNGLGLFSLSPNQGLTGAGGSSVAFSDVDADGDSDLLITGQNAGSPLIISSLLYINDGSGVFTSQQGIPFSAVQNSSVAFADVDGNQTNDLVITGDGGGSNYIAKLYISDTSGIFTEVQGAFSQGVRYSSIAFADVDDDEDQDLLITGLGFMNPSTVFLSKLLINNGLGQFSESITSGFPGIAWSSVAFADVDGDDDMDLFMAGGSSGGGKISSLYINDGNGQFSLSGQSFTPVDKASIAFADVDADGDPDLLITGESSQSGKIAELYLNDGVGHFVNATGLPFSGVGEGSVAFADVNGDGLPDLVITGEYAGGSSLAKLYLNTGLITNSPITRSDEWSVYPNPATDYFCLKSKNGYSISRIWLTDPFGRRIYTSFYENSSELIFKLEGLSMGYYCINILTTDGMMISVPLIKN